MERLRTLAVLALLILQCEMPLIMGDTSQYMDIDSNFPSVGTVNFRGSKLRVFNVEGAHVAEPSIRFGETCDSLMYNNLYLKYQLTLPIHIDVNTLASPVGSSKKTVAMVTLTRLLVKADKAFASKDTKLTLMTHLTRPGEAELIILCDTFVRCQQLSDVVNSSPEVLRRAVRFVPVGRIGTNTVRFGAIRSANPPKFNCNPGRWIVFQRRVDGSLSFAKNWDAYVKGFGDPASNYWMGLDQLSALTVTGQQQLSSRCQLRIEVETFKGVHYWGEYKMFQVLGPGQNYRLRVGQVVPGSQLSSNMVYSSESEFSTYDRDHDKLVSGSCSQCFGYGGWWYNHCSQVNLNAAYATDKSIQSSELYAAVLMGGHVPVKTTLMKLKCG